MSFYKVLNNQKFSKINLDKEDDVNKILINLKNFYEDQWKKNNEINTSIKLPITISIASKNYKRIIELEKTLDNIDLIADFYILKFDNENTQYKIIYNGSPKTFLNNMANNNFNLILKNNVWAIK